jgi:hypothetical protein
MGDWAVDPQIFNLGTGRGEGLDSYSGRFTPEKNWIRYQLNRRLGVASGLSGRFGEKSLRLSRIENRFFVLSILGPSLHWRNSSAKCHSLIVDLTNSGNNSFHGEKLTVTYVVKSWWRYLLYHTTRLHCRTNPICSLPPSLCTIE